MDSNIIVEIIAGVFGLATIILTALLNKSMKSNKEKLPELNKHHVFTRLEVLKNHISVNFSVQNKGKELVFKELLNNNLDIWKENLKELADILDTNCESMDNVAFQNTILNQFEKGLVSFSSFYQTESYTNDEQEVLKIVMKKFNKWNYKRVDSFRDTLMIVCTTQFYLDKKVKSAVIFDMYISFFVDTIYDAENTLGELNGDLRGCIFKGITI
jgi:hypothetical protein